MSGSAYPAEVAIPSLPPARYLLHRLDGACEAAIDAARPAMPTELLGRLLAGADGAPVDLSALPVAVHDRLLARIYIAELGESVTCRASCSACGEGFEFRFALPALLASQDSAAAGIGRPGEDGRWAAPGGVRLRPPTLADTGAGAAETLLERLAAGPVPEEAVEAVSAFLEKASPLLSLDIATACPECRADQAVWFDLARFLVQALAGERPFLIRETHLLAARYGWSHAEIMALPREDRRAFATLIESERSASLRRAS